MKIQSVCIPQGELLPGEVMPNRNRKSSSVLQKSCKKKKKKKPFLNMQKFRSTLYKIKVHRLEALL